MTPMEPLMSRSSLLRRLDASVQWTGIPALAAGTPRRRRLRWAPVVALALATAGFGMGLCGGRIWFGLGYALQMFGFAIAAMLPIFGPLKPWGSAERADEFDRVARSRAYLATFATGSIVTMLSIWLILAATVLGDWPRERLIGALALLGFYLMTIYSAMPTLHASWTIRPIADED